MSEGNGFVTREALFGACKRRVRDFEIDGVGKFRIRSLMESEKAGMEAPNLRTDGKLNLDKIKDMRLRAIVATVVDADGNTIFGNHDIGELRKMDSSLVSRIYAEIADHCGLDKDGVASAEKNSEQIPVGDSP